MGKQVIIGYSGHSYVVLDAAKRAGLQIKAYTEKEKRTQNPFNLEYFGFEDDENFDGWNKGYEFILGIGDNRIRERVADLIITKEEKLQSVIHPSANTGSSVEIGIGTFVASGVMINPLVKIGKAVIINTGSIVEHECDIGNSVHIAPGAVLAGNVKVGRRSFIGANAVIKEGVKIGNDVIIGAGTVVLNDVESECKVVGNPGKVDMNLDKVLIIAEAGVNHNGDLQKAIELIDVASKAGVDIVKFQTFKADKIVSKAAKKAKYQSENIGEGDDSQYNMLKSLELSEEDHETLIKECKKRRIQFLSTAFDVDGIDFLSNLGLPFFKSPSGEITNYPYLKCLAEKEKPVVLSTGMADMGEVKFAVQVLTNHGLEKKDITVLHCNTEYPTPMEDVNLRAMNAIGKELGVQVGYSDHTLGIEVPIAAVAMGAKVIEKHFTLDRNLPGPDHRASLEPDELKEMVAAIRNIEIALSGSGRKEPSPSELKNKEVARKSIHITRAMKAGEIITEKDIIALRPGNGISPMEWENVIGRKVNRAYSETEMLEWSSFK